MEQTLLFLRQADMPIIELVNLHRFFFLMRTIHQYCFHDNDEKNKFATLCDSFNEIDLASLQSTSFRPDLRNETDEMNCDDWSCNNIYTHCDGFWNCKNGMDDANFSRDFAKMG
jgi:dihydroxyacid dehydratase/phosphogluconate dehydratase